MGVTCLVLPFGELNGVQSVVRCAALRRHHDGVVVTDLDRGAQKTRFLPVFGTGSCREHHLIPIARLLG